MKEIRLSKPITIYRVYEPVKIISNIEKINHQKRVIDRLSRKIQKLKQENKKLKINRDKAIRFSVERDDLLEEIKRLKDRVEYLENKILINKRKNHMILLHSKIIERYIGDNHE